MAYEPSKAQRDLAAAMKAAREEAGLTQGEAARLTGIDRSALSRKEGGKAPFENKEITALGSLYGCGDERLAQLCEMGRESRTKAWWRKYQHEIGSRYYDQIGYEWDAAGLDTMSLFVFDGLTQTPDYAAAVLKTNDVTDEGRIAMHLEVRERRQRRLADDRPLRIDSVFDEAVLRRAYGGADVLRGQLAHLLELAKRPNITLRMLPSTAVVERAPCTVLSFGGAKAPKILIVDAMVTTAILDDSRDIARAVSVLDTAKQLALPPEATVAFIAETLKEI